MTEVKSHLSDDVAFTHYDVTLTPDLETFTFAGAVVIDCTFKRTVRTVTLHEADLEIAKENVKLWLSPISYLYPSDIVFDVDRETVTFIFSDDIPPRDVRLSIDYRGTLNDKMSGFYRSVYKDADGNERYMATTQLEPTDARRALPCADEPARKATFDVTLVVPEDMDALSNMPVIERNSVGNGKTKLRFDTTPKMSTYLLAFIVGDLEYIEGSTNNGTLVRVYTVPGKKEQGRFALETAIRVLEFYNDYFGIPYPLPKMDMVAIPDFAAGAMENWGLITYRENAILLDPENSSAAAKQWVAEVVAHEIAHQWFGNLVTMQTFIYLWLNEGFATWMGTFAVDNLFPEWDIWTQFVGGEHANALSLDGLRSSHQIETEVYDPDDITQVFDAINYNKGASVNRMIHDSIGPDAFRSGLQTYLKHHAYGNATTEDLWDALREASGGKQVHSIMDTWTKQAGYPVIHLTEQSPGVWEIRQERFLSDGSPLTPEEREQHWEVPLSVLYSRGGKQESFMIHFSEPRKLELPDDIDWVKLNPGQVTLARVNYTERQWNQLTEAARTNQLSVIDRFGLMSDALSLARAGHLPTFVPLNLLEAFVFETDYTVWSASLGTLGAVANLVEETEHEEPFNRFAQHTLTTVATHLGWEERESERHTTRLLRGRVLDAMGEYKDLDTMNIALIAFHGHTAGKRTLEPNLRSAVYGTVARQNIEREFGEFVRLYEATELQEEKVRLLHAMGCFTDEKLSHKVLDWAFDIGNVRAGDFFYLLDGVGSSAPGRRVGWDFLTNNWDTLKERFETGGLKLMGEIVECVIGGFTTNEDADMVERFFVKHSAPSATRVIAESLERIRLRATWYARDRKVIAEFLSDY